MSKRTERPSRRDPRGERPSRGPRRGGPSGPRRDARDEGGSDERPPRRGPRPEGDGPPPRRGSGPTRGGSARPSKPFRERNERDDRPPRRGSGERNDRGPRDDRGGERRSSGRSTGGPSKRSFGARDERPTRRSPGDRDERPGRRPSGDRPDRPARRSFGDRDERPARRSSGDRDERPGRRSAGDRPDRPARPSRDDDRGQRPAKPWPRQSKDERTFKEGDPLTRRPFRKGERSNRFSLPNPANEGLIRLNRYLANAGVGSRRESDELITSGAVTVNGKVVTELGTKVKPTDIVHFGGQKLSMEQKRYVLLNKPKDTITTTDDPKERHTVMDLIAKAGPERLYPVGRLDRQTTGVLLLTNDGDLAKRLTHPSHGAEKIYHVTLDKAVTAAHLQELVDGVRLDDGPAHADEANYVAGAETRREVGVKLHMGRNRVVRRMFEALGYEVMKLDRVLFAGLTKKDLQRGHWRHLSEKEVAFLKQLKPPPKATKAGRGGGRMRRSYGDE